MLRHRSLLFARVFAFLLAGTGCLQICAALPLVFPGATPPTEEALAEILHLEKQRGADGPAATLRRGEGSPEIEIPVSGILRTQETFGQNGMPYDVNVSISWADGSGIGLGVAGQWFELSKTGVRHKKGWTPASTWSLPTGQFFALSLQVHSDRIVMSYEGKDVEVPASLPPAPSPFILRGWKEGLRCRSLSVRSREVSDPATAASPARRTPSAGTSVRGSRAPELYEITQEGKGELAAAVVLVEGDVSKGTGFLTKLFDRPFAVSNAHVFVGNRRIRLRAQTGKVIPFENVYMAKEADLVLFELKSSDLPMLEMADDFETLVRPRMRIAVYGNSQGMGTITCSRGMVQSVGPDRVEVSAGYVQGNSGSPIVDEGSGKVIGVATFATNTANDWVAQGTRFNRVRRFGLRIDRLTPSDFEKLAPNAYRNDLDLLGTMDGCVVRLCMIAPLVKAGRPIPGTVSGEDDRWTRAVTEWNDALRDSHGGSNRKIAREQAQASVRRMAGLFQDCSRKAHRHRFCCKRFQEVCKEMDKAGGYVLKVVQTAVEKRFGR